MPDRNLQLLECVMAANPCRLDGAAGVGWLVRGTEPGARTGRRNWSRA